MTQPTPGAGITEADLISVREAQQEMMPELVTLFIRVSTTDSRGGTKISYVQWPQQSIGRVGGVRDQLRVAFAGQLRGKATAMLTLPVGTPLKEGYQVEVLGSRYNVVADLSKSSYATSARYLIEES